MAGHAQRDEDAHGARELKDQPCEWREGEREGFSKLGSSHVGCRLYDASCQDTRETRRGPPVRIMTSVDVLWMQVCDSVDRGDEGSEILTGRRARRSSRRAGGAAMASAFLTAAAGYLSRSQILSNYVVASPSSSPHVGTSASASDVAPCQIGLWHVQRATHSTSGKHVSIWTFDRATGGGSASSSSSGSKARARLDKAAEVAKREVRAPLIGFPRHTQIVDRPRCSPDCDIPASLKSSSRSRRRARPCSSRQSPSPPLCEMPSRLRHQLAGVRDERARASRAAWSSTRLRCAGAMRSWREASS